MWLFVSLLKTKKAAYCLDKLLSNNHLNGAANETRTRDPDLGKVVLYQLSYCRRKNFFGNFSCGEGLLRLGIMKASFPSALGLCDHCLRAFGIVFTYSINAGANHFQKNCYQRACFLVKAVQR